MLEHFITDTLQDALPDRYHQPAVYKCRNDAAEEDRSKHGKRHIKLAVIRILLPDQRDDVVIQEEPQ